MMMIRWWLLAMAVVILTLTIVHAARATSVNDNAVTSSRPHILFIVMDDLGSHDLGMHGTGIKTPACDDLAKQGLYLNQYYVLPVCSPTRCALMSGLYPLHTGNYWVTTPPSTTGLPLDVETLPQVLKKAGYRTHAIGKWHIGHSRWEQTPTFRGFDSFYGMYHGSQGYFDHSRGGGYDMIYQRREFCGPGCSDVADERGNYSTNVYTREAMRIIHEYKNQNDSDDHQKRNPLFIYLAFQAVHLPNEVPKAYRDIYKYYLTFSKLRKTYAGMLTAADEGIANVTQALKDTGLWNNTLVIFTTDNGGPTGKCCAQSNYPKRGSKGTIWEGGTTGDGFLSGPALSKLGIPTPGRTDHLFHVVDWLPTLAAMVGVSPSGTKQLDGVNQFETLRYWQNATHQPAREELYVGYAARHGKEWFGPAIRYKNWKLVQGKFCGLGSLCPHGTSSPAKGGDNSSAYALYDLSRDRSERFNIARLYPKVVRSLRARLRHYQETFVPPQTEDPTCPRYHLTNSSLGIPAWVPWCSGASEVVVYSSPFSPDEHAAFA